MSSEWDEYAGDWDSDEEVIQYSEKAFQSLGELVPLDGLNVLDFGCGTGLLAEKIAGLAKRVVGLDTSPAMLAVLEGKQLANVATLEGELSEELIAGSALLRSRFDLVVASSVCGFLPDYERTLHLLKSLIVPGGLFVQWDWLTSGDGSDHGFTSEMVLGALKGAGFDAVSVTSPYSMESAKGEMKVLMGVGRST